MVGIDGIARQSAEREKVYDGVRRRRLLPIRSLLPFYTINGGRINRDTLALRPSVDPLLSRPSLNRQIENEEEGTVRLSVRDKNTHTQRHGIQLLLVELTASRAGRSTLEWAKEITLPRPTETMEEESLDGHVVVVLEE